MRFALTLRGLPPRPIDPLIFRCISRTSPPWTSTTLVCLPRCLPISASIAFSSDTRVGSRRLLRQVVGDVPVDQVLDGGCFAPLALVAGRVMTPVDLLAEFLGALARRVD